MQSQGPLFAMDTQTRTDLEGSRLKNCPLERTPHGEEPWIQGHPRGSKHFLGFHVRGVAVALATGRFLNVDPCMNSEAVLSLGWRSPPKVV